MEIFAKDVIIGDFKFSDYGLTLASFDNSSEATVDLGMNHDTIEEYTGSNPVPIYLGTQYSSKLRPTLTIVKNPCVHTMLYFSAHECRELLRKLTGFYGYKKMQILQGSMDDEIFYNVRTISVKYQKVMGKIAGVVLDMECDSPFAWTKEMEVTIPAQKNKPFPLYIATDDLYHYVNPVVIIKSASAQQSVSLRNKTDNNWETIISGISANESITIDSLHQIILSSRTDRRIADDFNMHFPRFVPDQNIFITDQDISIQFKYTLPRKVGFV